MWNVEISVELEGVNEEASEELEVNLEISERLEDVDEDKTEKFVGNVAISEDLERKVDEDASVGLEVEKE